MSVVVAVAAVEGSPRSARCSIAINNNYHVTKWYNSNNKKDEEIISDILASSLTSNKENGADVTAATATAEQQQLGVVAVLTHSKYDPHAPS
eukprot:7033012-Ditylum_brightwellii.AAC.2